MSEKFDGQELLVNHELDILEKQKLTDRVRLNFLLGRPDQNIINDPEFQIRIPELVRIFRQTWRWHGTGRFQYNPENRDQIRDVLQTMIAENGLVPHRDTLDFSRGLMHSISTSPARTYSLLYALCHYEEGRNFFDKKHMERLWGYYYILSLGFGALKEAIKGDEDHKKLVFSKKWRIEHNLSKGGTRYFHDKYTKKPVSNFDMLKGGLSDIPDNYPILVGIKKGAFPESEIAKVLRKHESRSEMPISLDDLTHIEVPLAEVEGANQILQENSIDLPIIPIEWGNEIAKRLSFSLTMDGVENK